MLTDERVNGKNLKKKINKPEKLKFFQIFFGPVFSMCFYFKIHKERQFIFPAFLLFKKWNWTNYDYDKQKYRKYTLPPNVSWDTLVYNPEIFWSGRKLAYR